MKKIILLTTCLFIFGCGLEQDPFKEVNKKVKDSKPSEDQTEKPKPIPSDALRIESESIMTFQAGASTSYGMLPRVFLEGYGDFIISLDNQTSFPGIIYDPVNFTISWTPPADFVKDDFYTSKVLVVSLLAKSQDETLPPLMTTKKIQLIVNRSAYQAPKFVKAISFPTYMGEGEYKSFCGVFEDPDSLDQEGKRPRIEIFHDNYVGPNLSSYTRVSTLAVESAALNQWKFCFSVDLKEAEITAEKDEVQLEFRFVSRFNKPSPDYHLNFDVYGQMSKAVTDWDNSIKFTPTIKSQVSFFIFDPKFEGKVSVSDFKLPTGATLNCKTKNPTLQICEFIWTPDVKQADQYERMSMTLLNENTKNSRYSKIAYEWINLNVGKVPTVPSGKPNKEITK